MKNLKIILNFEPLNVSVNFVIVFLCRMSFDDFCKNFTKIEVCMLSPDSAGDSDKKRWEMQINQGTWQNHVSAGGCRNFPDSFHLNPQYM